MTPNRPRSPTPSATIMRPKGPSDAVPSAPVSIAVALADKLDLLAGFFAIGERPTGSGDPYALRRAALGVDPHHPGEWFPLEFTAVAGRHVSFELVHYHQRFGGNWDLRASADELFDFLAERLVVQLRCRG